MAKFMLLLTHAPDRYSSLSKEEYLSIVKDYFGWVEKMREAGRYQGGDKLTDGPGRVVSLRDGKLESHEGPYAEVREVLGGFMVIEAEDYDEACRLAADHPHLRHNGPIQIRQIESHE